MLAAEMGLTSFTSLAFCRASFLLMASSCSSSSWERSKTEKHRMTDEYKFASHVKAPWIASTNQNSDVPGALRPYTVDAIFTWGRKSHNGLKASLPWVIDQGKHQSDLKNPYRQSYETNKTTVSVHSDRITHSVYTTCETHVVCVCRYGWLVQCDSARS